MKFNVFSFIGSVVVINQWVQEKAVNTSIIKANLVSTKGKIYTLNKQQSWAKAVAAKEGK